MSFAGRTYEELVDEVLEFQFNKSKYEPLCKRWLNDAQRKAVLQSEFRTQEEIADYTTESSDGTLEVPTDFSRFIDIYNTETGFPLTPLDIRDYDMLTESSGPPTGYTIFQNEIHLYPTPDGQYKIALRYWKLPQDMVIGTDEPEIPAQYHDVLIAYAMMKAYARENDYQASNFWKAEWEAWIMKMRGEVQNDFENAPQQVPGSYGNEPTWGSLNVWR